MKISTVLFCAIFVVTCLVRFGQAKGCAGMCCPGRNNTCYTHGPRLSGKSLSGRCFCDENCLKMKDCCADYEKACTAVDCVASEWQDWGSCNKECGRGEMKRVRKIIVAPTNGGRECPAMEDKRVCVGRRCINTRHLYGKESRETASILPERFSQWRKHAKYNPDKGINRNLFQKYRSHMAVNRPGYCAIYEVTRAYRGCTKSSAAKWANSLQRGTKICVECQPSAMKKHLGTRCQGHGVYQTLTRWNAVMVPQCHGHWKLVSQHKECTCDSYSNDVTDNESFIFV